jgi:maltooligosyltrehalose trehalohydrolase
MLTSLPDPADPTTFQRCKLVAAERQKNREMVDMHRDLLKLRCDEPAIREPRVDGAVLGSEAFVLRFFGRMPGSKEDRLLVVNLGRDLHLSSASEPLLAPPADGQWRIQWSSEDPKYGGNGTAPPEIIDGGWHILGQAATLLRPAISDK